MILLMRQHPGDNFSLELPPDVPNGNIGRKYRDRTRPRYWMLYWKFWIKPH